MSAEAPVGRRFVAWLARMAAAAAMLAVAEVVLVATELVSALSSLDGAVQLWALLTATFLAPGLLLALPLALLDLGAVRDRLPKGTTLALTVAFLAILLLPWSAIESRLAMPDAEFPEPLAKLRWLGRALIGGSLLAGFALLGGLRSRLAHAPQVWHRRLAAACAALGALLVLWLAHSALARVHLPTLASLAAVGALVGVALALRALGWPRSAIESKPVLAAVAVVALLGVYVPGPGRDQARFALWGHTAAARVAEAVRRLLDRDGDAVLPAWLGGAGDCSASDGRVSPLEVEQPGDGVDQDCRGGDAPPRARAASVEPLADCERTEQPRDVIFITIDALRSDVLNPRMMPTLSELMNGSLVFERAYSPTVMTLTSMSAIFGGRPFADVGPKNALIDEDIAPDLTFPERFRAAGYRTAAFSDVIEHRILRRGFEHVNDHWHDPEASSAKGQLGSAAKLQGILEFLHSDKRPALAWAHVLDLHAPYALRRGSDGRLLDDVAAYCRAASYVDQQLTGFLLSLRQSGRLERSIIAITADHGEELQERGRVGHGPNLFEESIHVPLVIWAPGCRPRRVVEPVSLAHLAASLGRLANVTVPGVGLGERADLPVVSEAVTSVNTTYKRAIIRGRYKLMIDVANGGRLLFDLERDPGELTNIMAEQPGIVAELDRLYQRWLDAPGQR